jgi:hypothetical protein
LDWIIILSLAFMLCMNLGIWLNSKKAATGKALPAPAVVKQIDNGISSPDHMLVSTWIGKNDSTHAVPGWRWECACGVVGAATNASSKTNSLGSEENVIGLFKDHAKMYREVNGNSWKDAYDRLSTEHEAFVANCFCKDTVPHKPLERL